MTRPDEPTITQVASGSVNPLRYRHLVDMVSTFFTEHPIYDPEGQPIIVPEWSFPGPRPRAAPARAGQGRHRARRAGRSRRCRSAASRPRGPPPSRRSGRRSTGRSPTSSSTAPTPSARRSTASTACSRAGTPLDPEDQATFCFDPRVIDWDHYAPKVHLPSVVEHARVRTTPGGRVGEKREDRLRRQVLDPARHFAAFDLENTLIASNVVASYSWLATRRLPPEDRVRFVLKTLREAPALLALDRRDRSDFLRHFYRRYDGADVGAARGRRRRRCSATSS